MICTVYAHHTGFQQIKEIVEAAYPKGRITIGNQDGSDWLSLELEGGFLKKASKLTIRYRQRERLSYQITSKDNGDLVNNLKGLYGYVSSLPATNEKVKELFLHKIATLNCECSIQQESGETKGLKDLIARIAKEYDAILFVQPRTPISKSAKQHFLDKDLNLLLDQDGRSEIDHLDVKIESAYYDSEQTNVTEDQKARKTQSEAILDKMQIKVNRNLPCIESEEQTIIRTPKEIAQRVAVLGVTNLVAFGQFTGEEAEQYLKEHHLWEYVTPGEQAFLADPTPERKNHETWKCEDIWTLLWALEKVDTLPFPNTLSNLSGLEAEQYPVVSGRDPNWFIDSVTSARSKQEILDANDLYYRIDWACVDARINGREMKAVHPGVVYERHYALNWLIRYMDQEWDDVSCDT